jgi:ubiquinone/menaquinone biosynthesis C-methylase UbiE
VDFPASPFLNAVLNGRLNTTEEWHTYFETFHSDNPTANDLFTVLRNERAETSYDVLAREVVARGQYALEIACGDGHFVGSVADLVDPREGFSMHAIDVCRAELDIAMDSHPGSPLVRFDHCDASALPYEDGTFDVVTSHQFFNFLPQPLPYLAEAVRVLKRGGWLVFAVNRGWLSDRSNNWVFLHGSALSRVYDFYPSLVWPKMDDRRIYSDEGIEELLKPVFGLNGATLDIRHFTVSAMLTPARMAAVYNRLYLFASIPERTAVLDAVEEKAQQLVDGDGLMEIALPFRLVSVQKR